MRNRARRAIGVVVVGLVRVVRQIEREARRQRDLEQKRAESGAVQFDNPARTTAAQQVFAAQAPVAAAQIPTPAPVAPPVPTPAPEPVVQQAAAPKPDELTEKLKRLKMLFDNGLISQEEYNAKKLDLLSDF